MTDTSELMKVILADDHPLLREGVARSLTAEHGFEVVGETDSGEKAVQLARDLVPDLVVLDLGMGGGGGLAAAADILALDQPTEVAILTVSEDENDLLMALNIGVKGYILKGVTARELREALLAVSRGDAFISPALAATMLMDFSRPRHRHNEGLNELTTRENQILKLLGDGLTNREIADQLCLSEKTVKHHMTNVLQKLQVRNRVEAALISRERFRADQGRKTDSTSMSS
ncbi:response regulator transcription factor [Marinobacter sp.]|uniref:response regulator transcription factor n=1 Tax=Marinobacter sp. TaxID=50741 RepID=UPI002B483706|nr:response regulator transcription factor [Marinobacter sp.]HKK55679.1 response regulator transcription factor [Marinobacter sp.]